MKNIASFTENEDRIRKELTSMQEKRIQPSIGFINANARRILARQRYKLR